MHLLPIWLSSQPVTDLVWLDVKYHQILKQTVQAFLKHSLWLWSAFNIQTTADHTYLSERLKFLCTISASFLRQLSFCAKGSSQQCPDIECLLVLETNGTEMLNSCS